MQLQVHLQKKTKIIPVQKIRKEEKNTFWYSGEDFTQIQCDVARTVWKMQRSKPLMKNMCSRGLEYLKSDAHI